MEIDSDTTNSFVQEDSGLVIDLYHVDDSLPNNRQKKGRERKRTKAVDPAKYRPTIVELRAGKPPKNPIMKKIFEAALQNPQYRKLIEVRNIQEHNQKQTNQIVQWYDKSRTQQFVSKRDANDKSTAFTFQDKLRMVQQTERSMTNLNPEQSMLSLVPGSAMTEG